MSRVTTESNDTASFGAASAPQQTSQTACQHEGPGLGRQAVTGGIALTGARVFARGTGTLRQLLIPRWLGPAEMGVFGIAMLAVSAVEALSQPGLTAALMQKKGDYQQYVAPVRTVQAIRGLALSLLILITAPWLADFFDTPEAIGVLRALALLPLITGLEPLFATLMSKTLQFGRIVRLQVASGTVGLIISVGMAWHHPTVWALVVGTLAAALVNTVGAHFLCREGRAFSLRWGVLRDLHSFGFWIFVGGVVAYGFVKGGEWVIGRALDAKTLAIYQIAYWYSVMLTGEVGGIINQVIFPVFSKLQDDVPRLQSAFRKSFGMLAMGVMGAGALGCTLAPDYRQLVLGPKWAGAEPQFLAMVPWLTLWGVCSALAGAQSGVFQALGKPKWWALTVFAMLVVFAAGVWPAIRVYGPVGVAALLGGTAAIMQLVRYLIMARLLRMRARDVLMHVAIPLAAAVVAVALSAVIRHDLRCGALARAAVGAACCLSTYAGVLVLMGRWMELGTLDFLRRLKPANWRRP